MTLRSRQSVVLANVGRLNFCSQINDRPYSIWVAPPRVQAPGRHCPVFYVLDGYWYFASAVEAVRANVPEAVVVGIGYPDDGPHVQDVLESHRRLLSGFREEPGPSIALALQRLYDLTLPASDAALATDTLAEPAHALAATDVGGLDDFLQILETEVKPLVASIAAIDSSNQAIFGHSLGGLAVIHALFTRPNTYRTFIAASPAIWWNEKEVLAGEATFADAVRAGKASPRVLITMGSDEGAADPKEAARCGVDFARYAARLRKDRMIENARELTDRLRALAACGGFEVEDYALFPKQHHGISPWPALGRAVAFAFPP